MARTLIGRLQLIVQAMGLEQAKKVTSTIGDIERAAKRLSTAPWGQGFQRQIDKLALNARELDKVRRSWNSLHADMASRNLGAALKKSEISAWKTATLGHFSAVRAGMRDTEREAKRIGRAIRSAFRPGMIALGAGSGTYATGMLGREALTAGSEAERERFRQRMAAIPEGERAQIEERAAELSARYRSVSATDIAEMARVARGTMGSTERGFQILEEMVRGYVTLQSAKGVDAAPSEMSRLLRGIDNLGQNKEGDIGVAAVRDIINGLVRAAQIEGAELDVGSMFELARRAKVAGPALSTEFLMSVAPAIIQDMTASGAGTALAMAFKSFVVGDRSQAGKRYMEAQANLGLREGLVTHKGRVVDEGTFVAADELARNPYEWVKAHLVPALTEAGVDIADETAVAMAVGRLSGNTNATGMLTRMVTQMEQIDRLVSMYNRAMGTEAAEEITAGDPLAAWKGLKTSLENLSAATLPMPQIAAGLNSLSDTINAFAQRVRESDPAVLGATAAAGGAAALYGGYKVASGIGALVTAGPSLQTAAVMLQEAAIAQGAGGAPDAGGKRRGGGPWWLFGGATATAVGSALVLSGDTPKDRQYAEDQILDEITKSRGYDTSGPRNPRRSHFRGEQEREDSLGAYLDGPAAEAEALKRALSVKAKPEVDTSAIEVAIGKARQLLNLLTGAGAAAHSANAAVDAEMRRNMTDYGVVP